MNAADRALLEGVVRGERRALAKTITLLESTRPEHRRRADALLNESLSHAGRAVRLGISGVPGVGKSTFIEALKAQGADDIIVFVGGVIPRADYDFLYEAGVKGIYGPGTPIPASAKDVLEQIKAHVGKG